MGRDLTRLTRLRRWLARVDWPAVVILAYAFGVPVAAIVVTTFIWPK